MPLHLLTPLGEFEIQTVDPITEHNIDRLVSNIRKNELGLMKYFTLKDGSYLVLGRKVLDNSVVHIKGD